ncbi:MraY family glycosyltransferase [Nocardioides sp.]|jgi:UDP-GlcNAc:undecaprenyl-phosphate GlcNAc-1-phosphate transferase|uniref:glycosyltransferase family 4 protein n=1 Tax=Nocardioides sp. TaxID=35761 RepID=UPI002610D798|nr:MraY family glycosyltransferase [Nocardioides sp.]
MREYLVVFLVAAAVTYLLTVVAREIALRTGAVAAVRDRDVHAEPIPYLGGLAMLGGLVAAYFVARELPFLSTSNVFTFSDAGAVLLAGALICGVGVLDDIFELDALTKFGGQVLAVGLLVYSGIQFRFFFAPNDVQFSLDPGQGALLTALIVVATVNAVNFVDGLDGLAAGVVGISALAFFVYCYEITRINEVDRATTGAFLSAALAGVCVGFLVHNFHPARLFMGDSGSMLIGLVLSASAITVTTQFSSEDIALGADGARASWLPMLLPVALPILILIVPLMDLVLAVVRRTRAGRSPFAPDKQHLHHRLLEIGHSHRRAVVIMWVWAGLIAFATVLASLYTGPRVWATVSAGFAAALLLTFVLPILHRPGHAADPLSAALSGADEEPSETL